MVEFELTPRHLAVADVAPHLVASINSFEVYHPNARVFLPSVPNLTRPGLNHTNLFRMVALERLIAFEDVSSVCLVSAFALIPAAPPTLVREAGRRESSSAEFAEWLRLPTLRTDFQSYSARWISDGARIVSVLRRELSAR